MTTPTPLHPIFDQHRIEAVAFDLHDTLVRYPAIERFLAAELPLHCPTLDPHHVAAAWRHALHNEPTWPTQDPLPTRPPIPRSFRDIWTQRLIRGGLTEPTIAVLLDAWSARVAEAPPLPGAVATVRAIGQRFPTAIVSNGDDDYVTAAVAAAPFHVTTVISSESAGAPKPTGHIFRLTAERLGVDPTTVLFVGDSPRHDMDGARAAGMHPVWKRPSPGSPWPRPWQPLLIIDTVRQLAPPPGHPHP